jgi:hypothetical protein
MRHLKALGVCLFLALLAIIPLGYGGYLPFPQSPPATSGSVLTSTSAGVMSWVSPLPLANGGTNATSKSTAFDSLSPMTTSGDVIVGGASGTGTRAACATANTVLHGGTPPACSAVVSADVSGAIAISHGGTGQTTQTAGFDALSPMTTSGDIIVGGTSGTGTRSACATANTVLRGGTPAACGALVNADIPATLDSKTITNSTIGNTNTIAVKDSNFTIRSAANVVNFAWFDASLITTGLGRLFTFPNAAGKLVIDSIDNAFTNKQTITASTAQTGLAVNGVSGNYTVDFENGASAGNSFGLLVKAGGNASDYSMVIENRSGVDRLLVRGDGAISMIGSVSITGTGGNVTHGCNIQTGTTTSGTGSKTCANTGEGVTGGGCVKTAGSGFTVASYPSSFNTWRCDDSAADNITIYAICCAN